MTELAMSDHRRCPLCRELSERPAVIHVEGNITTATFLCPNDHLWQVRWLEADAA
jgi:hypothetical protein